MLVLHPLNMSLRQVLTPQSTMRDIHDYCVQNNIYSLSQGMIEVRRGRGLKSNRSEARVAIADFVAFCPFLGQGCLGYK